MLEARKLQLLDFCKRVQIDMQDLSLLDMALTHSSYANESKGNNQYNERIEFLGDSVLSVIVSTYMYNKCVDLPEGQLTVYRAHLVCEKSLHKFAKVLRLGDYLQLGRGEEKCGGRTRASILADAFEAVLGAIYVDRGMEYARAYLMRIMQNTIDDVCAHGIPVDEEDYDYKTFLQEEVQRNGDVSLLYHQVSSSGPEHNKTFNVEVELNGTVIGAGSGHRKKEAEQMAAKDALEKLKIEVK